MIVADGSRGTHAAVAFGTGPGVQVGANVDVGGNVAVGVFAVPTHIHTFPGEVNE